MQTGVGAAPPAQELRDMREATEVDRIVELRLAGREGLVPAGPDRERVAYLDRVASRRPVSAPSTSRLRTWSVKPSTTPSRRVIFQQVASVVTSPRKVLGECCADGLHSADPRTDCGKQHKTLRRHLEVAHQLTPEPYRERFGLKRDYPMVPPGYSRQRSEMPSASAWAVAQ
jgi:ROS/MUCR transcriptional regulator protein